MKALVTGGRGFLGGAIARELAARGNDVAILDLLPGKPGRDPAGIACFEGDIRDPAAVRAAIRGRTHVFHAAAVLSFWRRRRALQRDVNVEGTRVVMEAAIEAGVARVVHTSSVNALGYPEDPSRPGDEETAFNWGPPGIGYMDSKRAAEEIILDLVRTRGLPAVVVNPGTMFGSSACAGLNSELYIGAIARGRLRAYLDGGANFVGVEDVVSGHLLAAEKGRPGERYILGGENLTYQELFAKISAAVDADAPRRRIPYAPALAFSRLACAVSAMTGREPLLTPEIVRAGCRRLFYSSDKARRELGYAPRPFDAALADTIAFMRRSGLLNSKVKPALNSST
jgi:dihydroflavonol-4-reductase